MIRIAVTGPESSGKSTLAKALADHYNVDFIPEFAREYLENSGGSYSKESLDEIAKGQYDHMLLSNDDYVFCDTDFSVLEIWSDYKFGSVSDYLLELVQEDLFDLHILCAPDIPWEEDPLRENPESRDELFELYLTSLKKYNKNYIIVKEGHQARVEKSLKSIDLL